MLFQRVAVVGVGLIGGSFALALKQAKACAHVVGVGRSPANMKTALERGAIDSIAADVSSAVADCDLVLIATPVAQFQSVFSQISKTIGDKALVTDGGSTKQDVIAAARSALGKRIGQFVPAHPIAGGERSGAAVAEGSLYRGKRVILTPLKENDPSSIERIKSAWEACGARVSTMGADEHDSVLAAVSHLPHVLAYALAQDVAARDNSARLFEIAGAGFRDFTRLASSHPEMWRDICMANRDALLAEIAQFESKLARMKNHIAAGEGDALEKLFAQARDARDKWLNS